MPDNRRIQGPEESFSPLLYLREEDKPQIKTLINSNGQRLDGRTLNELRPTCMQTGINPHATGSAYLETGSTKILCTIYGPKESVRREEFATSGRVVCEFKYAPFSCARRRQYHQDVEEKDFSSFVTNALTRSVKLDAFPKLQLEVNILILENGGTLAGSINCASLALADSGLEMYNMPVASTVAVHKSGCLIDPSICEEYTNDEVIRHPDISGSMTVAYLTAIQEISGFKQDGVMEVGRIRKGVDMCLGGCLRILKSMREYLETVTAQ
ncbi:exosome complex component MTR3-like isoform X2 [Halichondria panicea]|uniref:exosome complex component MTR3-like isoform X2 n=1 Tax=Halichondria panicea TaxID=6063 RepID=UPI00312B3C38